MSNIILAFILFYFITYNHYTVESTTTANTAGNPLIALRHPETTRTRRSPKHFSNEALATAFSTLQQVINRNGGADMVNTNVQAAYNVIYSEEVQNDLILRHGVKFNANGHTCDVALCNAIGNEQIAIGACTDKFCHCGSNMAFLKSCGPGTIYDAFLQNCNWPNNVPYCA